MKKNILWAIFGVIYGLMAFYFLDRVFWPKEPISITFNPDWYSEGKPCDLDYDTASKQYLDRIDEDLKTAPPFHSLVRKPTFLSLPFPGYIIGIEGGKFINLDNIIQGFLTPLFISHIGRFQTTGNRENNWTTCFIHNAYYYDDNNYENSVVTKDDKRPMPKDIAFDPLKKLEQEIRGRFEEGKRPTHIIVMSTGYNTPQWESLSNYNELFQNIKKASGVDTEEGSLFSKKFKPLFIGISWRSYTPSRLVIEGASKIDFPAAAKRADVIGEKLGTSLLQNILLPLKGEYRTKIVLIGHSLGARILSKATYRAPPVEKNGKRVKVDLLIGLQGAFRFNRYLPKSRNVLVKMYDFFFGDNLYENHEKFVDTAIYTTSENDKLLSLMADMVTNYFDITSIYYIGSKKARDLASKEDNKNYFSITTLNRDGKLKDKNFCRKETPVLVDAEDSIKNTIPGSDESVGAHSDIYNRRIGRFLWNVINECTILNQAPETN